MRNVVITTAFAVLTAPWMSAQTNVTTTVHDYNGTSLLLMRSDDYNGSGCGGNCAIYSSQKGNGGKYTLQSEIDSKGSWQLFLFNQSVRTLYITPNEPVGPQPAGPPAGYYWQNVEVYSQCYDTALNLVPFQNLVNGSTNCSLGADFTVNSTKYKLVMSPHLPAAGPATGLAAVSCNATANVNGVTQCINWTIAPNMAAANGTVANLYYYGRAGTLVFVGQYYNTYLITITNP